MGNYRADKYQICLLLNKEDGKLLRQLAERKGVQPGVFARIVVKEYLANRQEKEKE